MIKSIELGEITSKNAVKVHNEGKTQNNKTISAPSFSGDYTNASLVNALQAKNNISFGQRQLTPFELNLIGQGEIRVPNLLNLQQEIHLSSLDMPKDKIALNAAGLNVEFKTKGNQKLYKITNDKNDVLFLGRFDTSKPLPEIIYKQGKYMPEITVKDSALQGKKIKMFAGSKIVGENFEMEMPGKYEPVPGQTSYNVAPSISFKGHVAISTLNKEDRTQYAFNKWYDSDLPSKAIKGDYAAETAKYDPNTVLLMGGFGERFRNITRDKENKPSAKLPTDDKFRIMATTLNLAASAGLLGKKGKDEIAYISQKHTIKGPNVYDVDEYKADGGAIAEALNRSIIRNDKDNIILNGDIFTNADISRTYHALKSLPNAGLVIPYYPVNPDRAKSFGMLGVEKDRNGNLQIKSFIEKPKYTNNAPMPDDFVRQGEYDEAFAEYLNVQKALLPGSKDVYLANPGLYFISEEASKVLMAAGIMDPKGTGLGKNIMPKIVELANEGRLKDKDGNQLKVYTVPLEAKGGKPAVWEDIGTAEAYLKVIKDVAAETSEHGTGYDNRYYGMPNFVLNDFKKNVDLKSGIVYGSDASRQVFDDFKQKYGVDEAKGNIFVTID